MGSDLTSPLQITIHRPNQPLIEWIGKWLNRNMFEDTKDRHGYDLLNHQAIMMVNGYQQYDQILSIPTVERQCFIDAFIKTDDSNTTPT